ncbi:uncharacterized protein ACN427_005144 [Glossina fuscipes fuscipes]
MLWSLGYYARRAGTAWKSWKESQTIMQRCITLASTTKWKEIYEDDGVDICMEASQLYDQARRSLCYYHCKNFEKAVYYINVAYTKHTYVKVALFLSFSQLSMHCNEKFEKCCKLGDNGAQPRLSARLFCLEG